MARQVAKGVPGAPEALARLEEAIAELHSAEPTLEEQLLAADLENAAQAAGLALDSGESLLCALSIIRGLEWLATGDKRAIASVEALITLHPRVKELQGRVVCLEQLVMRLVTNADGVAVRNAICGAQHVDKSLNICMSCSSQGLSPEVWRHQLASYVLHLRVAAPTILAP